MNHFLFFVVLLLGFANIGFAINDYASSDIDGGSLYSAFIGGVLLTQAFYNVLLGVGDD